MSEWTFDRDAIAAFRFVRCDFDDASGVARLVYAFDEGPELVETITIPGAPFELDDVRRAMAASIACRAAIKINMRLEPAKIDWLLRSLAATSCPMSCPHGRPIALRYSTRDILKSFHRI
jgi:DNA mismatch repair ATPase MutL